MLFPFLTLERGSFYVKESGSLVKEWVFPFPRRKGKTHSFTKEPLSFTKECCSPFFYINWTVIKLRSTSKPPRPF